MLQKEFLQVLLYDDFFSTVFFLSSVIYSYALSPSFYMQKPELLFDNSIIVPEQMFVNRKAEHIFDFQTVVLELRLIDLLHFFQARPQFFHGPCIGSQCFFSDSRNPCCGFQFFHVIQG